MIFGVYGKNTFHFKLEYQPKSKQKPRSKQTLFMDKL